MQQQAGTFEENTFLRGKAEYLRISPLGTKDAPSLAETSAYDICQKRLKNKKQDWNNQGASKSAWLRAKARQGKHVLVLLSLIYQMQVSHLLLKPQLTCECRLQN